MEDSEKRAVISFHFGNSYELCYVLSLSLVNRVKYERHIHRENLTYIVGIISKGGR